MTMNKTGMLPEGYEGWSEVDGWTPPNTDFLSVAATIYRKDPDGGFGSGRVETVHQTYYVPPTLDDGARPVQKRFAPYIESMASKLDALPRGSVVTSPSGTAWMKVEQLQWANPEGLRATSGHLIEYFDAVTVIHVDPQEYR